MNKMEEWNKKARKADNIMLHRLWKSCLPRASQASMVARAFAFFVGKLDNKPQNTANQHRYNAEDNNSIDKTILKHNVSPEYF
jgi:hypothetical protein